jgi:hypothetical protein
MGAMEPLHELRDLVARHAGAGPQAISQNDALGVRFIATRCTSKPSHHLYEPVFSLVVQGEKRAVLGDKVFTCRAGHFLVASVDLPLTIQTDARPDRPFMALGMTLNPAKVARIARRSKQQASA